MISSFFRMPEAEAIDFFSYQTYIEQRPKITYSRLPRLAVLVHLVPIHPPNHHEVVLSFRFRRYIFRSLQRRHSRKPQADCPECVCTSVIEKDVINYSSITADTSTETFTETTTKTITPSAERLTVSAEDFTLPPTTVTTETTITSTELSEVFVTIPATTTTVTATLEYLEQIPSLISTCADQIISISTSQMVLPCTLSPSSG
ncbi:hypothetical protein FE257_005352 [Aspergillus nanangensis]|uniref:Uncharacterized protein n=1 Tax=Aspergillus nanangensis TaxID=2582783 RepID=A0AAD4CQV4_ASPNN|nr:hypothetical protein FE257_005352 [Aspergillus nanangensis]